MASLHIGCRGLNALERPLLSAVTDGKQLLWLPVGAVVGGFVCVCLCVCKYVSAYVCVCV